MKLFRLPRVLRWVALSLLLGAIINIIVVASISYFDRHHAVLSTQTYATTKMGLRTAYGAVVETATRITTYYSEQMIPPDRTDYALMGEHSQNLESLSPPVWSTIDVVIRTQRPILGGHDDDHIIVVDDARGWPIPNCRSRISAVIPPDSIVPTIINIEGGMRLAYDEESWLHLPGTIPLRPIWPAFAGCSLMFGLAFFGATCSWVVFLRRNRD